MAEQRDPGKPQDQWVFLGATGFLFVALVMGLAREQHWGERFREVQLIAPTAAGLRTGIDVRISGLPVGQVVALEMQPDARVRIRMNIADRYQRLIGPKSAATQGVDGFVGDHFIAISPDPQPQDQAPSRRRGAAPLLLPYTQPVDITRVMEQLVTTQVSLQSTLRQISSMTAKHVPKLADEVSHTLAQVDQLSTTVNRELKVTAPQLRRSLQTVDRTGQAATQLMNSTNPLLPPTLQQVQDLARTANQLLRLVGASGWLEPATPQPQPNTQVQPNTKHPQP